MSVKSFECAIARSQIGRYLAGDTVGEEAMQQLETHIAACADCQRLIESKREELLGPLAHAPNAQEAIAGKATEATTAETLAASTDVAAIERELRAAAARSGRAVIENVTSEAVEARKLVGATASANSGMANGASNQGAPNSAAPHLTVETGSANSASSRSSLPKLGGIGAALGKVSLPKLVRDVPEPK
ncbi:zf-HC2 domain-containing protein, partial [bacterium]